MARGLDTPLTTAQNLCEKLCGIGQWGRVPTLGYNSKALGFVDPMGR
jgi:hypothetical protein